MTTSTHTIPGSNRFPWRVALPFNPNSPFSTGGLGALLNSAAVACTSGTYQGLSSSGNYGANTGSPTAGALEPIVNPADLSAGYRWYETFDESNLLILKPYLVKYDATPPTAFASTPVADAITAILNLFGIRSLGMPQGGLPMEFAATYLGSLTIKNNGVAANAASFRMPRSSQFCRYIASTRDVSLTPGIRITGNGEATGTNYAADTSAAEINLDRLGHEGVLIHATGLTANVGVGWVRSEV